MLELSSADVDPAIARKRYKYIAPVFSRLRLKRMFVKCFKLSPRPREAKGRTTMLFLRISRYPGRRNMLYRNYIVADKRDP